MGAELHVVAWSGRGVVWNYSAEAEATLPTLMERALELVRGCGCSPDTGCPGCVQHTECGEYNAVLSKVRG